MANIDGEFFKRPPSERLPCGGVAHYEVDSSCHSYRCDACFAVVGSIGMPAACAELLRQTKQEEPDR